MVDGRWWMVDDGLAFERMKDIKEAKKVVL
jgi:hypothetical protein